MGGQSERGQKEYVHIHVQTMEKRNKHSTRRKTPKVEGGREREKTKIKQGKRTSCKPEQSDSEGHRRTISEETAWATNGEKRGEGGRGQQAEKTAKEAGLSICRAAPWTKQAKKGKNEEQDADPNNIRTTDKSRLSVSYTRRKEGAGQ